MEESPRRSRMTLRQALSRQWQIPLFILSMIGFGLVLIHLRPQTAPLSFDEKFDALEKLSHQNRYTEFYTRAEKLRKESDSEDQLGRIHSLAARTRVKQLRQRHEFGISLSCRSAPKLYEYIIYDYTQAIHFKHPAIGAPECEEVYRDMSLAYWCLNDSVNALKELDKAIEVTEDFTPSLHRLKVSMLLAARPEDYFSQSMTHLENLLNQSASSEDDRAWAFVRKAEVLISQDKEEAAFTWINSADDTVLQSRYADEVEFLRGRALRQAGEYDAADTILRNLLGRTTDRGDIYAQTALELGRINYDQYRDYDAQQFYRKVIETQMGKDWYAAGLLGLAECTALRQQYPAAAEYYQEAVRLWKQAPQNRALTAAQIRKSLTLWSQKLDLLKQYEWALLFLEIEQQLAGEDIFSAHRFAQAHARRAVQILDELKASQQSAEEVEPTEKEKQWLAQQHEQITRHFEQAAEQYLRVASLASGNNELYGDCLWQSAQCYDKAGKTDKAIEVWQRYVHEREGESRWPRALFNVAQAHQALRQIKEAIGFYELLLREHPKSLAAFDALVPLARCYLARDPPEVEEAEQLLRRVREDPTLTPRAPYFRDALFALGETYYNSKKYAQAINVLTEAIDRYEDDPQLGKSMFLVADSYRKSGLALDATLQKLAQDPTAMINLQKTSEQRRRYLESAGQFFDQAIETYMRLPEGRRSEQDRMYLRHCWLYRADCSYDLGRYRKAAQLYELAALRYQLTPTALAAFMQLVNCHLEMGNIGEARSTTQRAMWQLREMPDAAFTVGLTKLNRQQWQEWFDWTAQSNLW
jgi:tetratricopeptide (TPR) repeat protein